MDIDLTTLDDDQLDQLRIDVLSEREHRTNMAAIPTQVAELSKTYREGGGEPGVLLDAITAPAPPPLP